MQKWMIEFLRKFENRGIIIELIRNTKSVNLQLFTLIFSGEGVRCDPRRFPVLSPFLEKSMINIILHNKNIGFAETIIMSFLT